MSFFSRLSRAAKAALDHSAAARYRVKGDVVECPVCEAAEFVLVTDREFAKPLFGRRNVPWLELDRRSTTLICTHCSHLLQFGRAPERADNAGLELNRDAP